jgi:hypothetical protein
MGGLELVCKLLNHPDSKITDLCVIILGNVSAGSNEQMDALLSYPIMPILSAKLNHAKLTPKKNALWLLSNVAADNLVQVKTLLQEQEI